MDTSWLRLGAMVFVWIYCVISWFCGVSLPVSQLDVMPGTALHWRMTRSVTHTLNDLVIRHSWFALIMLTFFSLVVPIAKLSGTGYLLRELTQHRASDVATKNRTLILLLSYLASYQFVDLYVGMFFVAYFNSEASDCKVRIGFYWFFSYCVLSLALSVVLDKTLLDSEPSEATKGAGLQDNFLSTEISTSLDFSGFLSGFGRQEGDTAEDGTEKQPPMSTTRFFAGCFMVFLMLSPWDRFLEVRMLVHGVAVERTVLSLKQVWVDSIPLRVHYVVSIVFWMLIFYIPLGYAIAQLGRIELHRRYKDQEWSIAGVSVHELAKTAADILRQWAHVDVVAIAAMVFLFMIQDSQTLTKTPDGSFAFYLFIAASFSFFFLRWFSESEISNSNKWAPRILVGVFVAFVLIIWTGVPGAQPHFEYRSLDSVCAHAQPFLHGMANELPAAYGNCLDVESHPPQPCMGDENLQTSGDDKDYMNAIWLGGIQSFQVSSCKITKVPPEDSVPGTSSYHFKFGGHFDKLTMFLRVRQCTFGKCVEMNSADHCCGHDIGFNFTFAVNCRESPGSTNAIRSLKLMDAEFGGMYVSQDFFKGAVKIQAKDISGQVEASLRDHIEKVLHAKVQWGKHMFAISDMLNKLVQYNAPSDAGRCL